MSHLVGHAFFKALLFLGAGWLAVLAGATALAALRGSLHGTGALRWSIGLGLAALAGVPPLIGFFTKDTVIDAAIEGATGGGGARAWLVVLALFVTVVLTAAYCARAWLLLDTSTAVPQLRADPTEPELVVAEEDVAVVRGADSADDAEVERVRAHGHRPITLSAALAVAALAALTVLGTLLLSSLPGAIHIGVLSALLSLLLVAGAGFAVWTVSDRGRRDVADEVPGRLRDAAVRGFGVDTAYVGVGRAVTALARLVVVLDRDVVDAYPRAAAVVAARPRSGRRAQPPRRAIARAAGAAQRGRRHRGAGSDGMALTLVLLLPLLGAIALIAIPGESRVERGIALLTTVVTALLAVVVVAGSHEVDAPWIRSLGIRWHFAVDGISAALVLLTALLTVAVVVHTLAGRTPPGGSASTFLGCILLVETGALATFLARDAVLFFIAFEVVLVPMWVLIRSFGDDHVPDERRADAAGRFVLFTVLGSTLMLVGILFLVHHQGTSDLEQLARLHGAGISRSLQIAIAAILLLGLGIKVPVWPMHTWLPPAHTVAPTAGSVLLAAVLLKMGTYGIVRLVVATVPAGVAALSPVLAILGAVGILWGGLACLVERDLKRLIAYSSVAHMGFVVLALASGSDTGLQAALFGNIAHGVVAALLFFLVGDLKEQWGSADLRTVHVALRDRAPRFGIVLLIGFAAALGLPGLVSFWGEFLALYAAWSPAPDRARRAAACLRRPGRRRARARRGLLPACRPDRLVRGACGGRARGTRACGGRTGRDASGVTVGGRFCCRHRRPNRPRCRCDAVVDARGARWAVVLTLAVAVVVLGILPQLLLATSGPDAVRLITGLGVP